MIRQTQTGDGRAGTTSHDTLKTIGIRPFRSLYFGYKETKMQYFLCIYFLTLQKAYTAILNVVRPQKDFKMLPL